MPVKTLLIVDDADIVRRSLSRILRDLGFDYIREANDGTQGLAMAKAEVPALIITDGEMREMHGPELIKELRKDPTLAAVPVIMCSGNGGLREVAEALGVPFFEKSKNSPRDLIAMVQEALG
jgi:two-component system chemotaxis response regulator CheY